jgi:hypothetical protein
MTNAQVYGIYVPKPIATAKSTTLNIIADFFIMSRGNFDAILESHISNFCNPKGLPYKYCNIVNQGFKLAICKYKCLPKIHNSIYITRNPPFLTFLTILTSHFSVFNLSPAYFPCKPKGFS